MPSNSLDGKASGCINYISVVLSYYLMEINALIIGIYQGYPSLL